ncbi:phage portal protein [Amycolatopsis sp. VS8301801F10]|uniref:phage portal protein n=1 Tax=Amycolatopsis sp. VS8301801F10 TaxID=2652442 RepID=UPI0038FCF754
MSAEGVFALALPDTPEEWVQFLSERHDAELPELEMLNRYYEGTQPLAYMHPEIFREVGEHIRPVIIGWPQLVPDAIEERLEPEGFRLPDEDGEDTDLWRVWQANDMDEQSQMGRVDALVMKRSYITVGTNEDDADTPLVTAESPLEMFSYIDPRTRKELAALRRVTEGGTYAHEPERTASLYLPNTTIWYGRGDGGWREDDRDNHGLGMLPVVSLINRGRLSGARTLTSQTPISPRYGRSELAPIIPISDAACKIATDMMLGAESAALPVRGFFGVGPDDLEDVQGNKLTAIQMLVRKFLTVPIGTDDGAREFAFPAANLAGFHESINALARIASSLSGLPPDYFGLTTDNPPSAESRLAAEIRLIKRAERKQTPFGGAYERTGRLVKRFQTGEWDPRYRMLETRWRDPSTPTVAQTADAAIKKYTAPAGQKPIVTLRQTREDLRYSDAQIRRMEKEDEEADRKAAELDPISVIADRIQPSALEPGQAPEPAGVGA